MNSLEYFFARCSRFFLSIFDRRKPSHNNSRNEKSAPSTFSKPAAPSMFDHVDQTIKSVAKIFLVVEVAISIIVGLGCLSRGIADGVDSLIIIGVVVLFPGTFVSWFNNVLLYGFGSLIENTKNTAENNTKHGD